MKIPFDPDWDRPDPEWGRHWAAHEMEECLPNCRVCESMEEDRIMPNGYTTRGRVIEESREQQLRNFSQEELREELERREREKREAEKPQRVSQPNWNHLAETVDQYIENLHNRIRPDDDLVHYVFEAAVAALYGKDIWQWANRRLSECD